MITIEDHDLPITAAQKLISGTKPYSPTPLESALAKVVTGEAENARSLDMFSVDELREIADYLYVYCNAHTNGD